MVLPPGRGGMRISAASRPVSNDSSETSLSEYQKLQRLNSRIPTDYAGLKELHDEAVASIAEQQSIKDSAFQISDANNCASAEESSMQGEIKCMTNAAKAEQQRLEQWKSKWRQSNRESQQSTEKRTVGPGAQEYTLSQDEPR